MPEGSLARVLPPAVPPPSAPAGPVRRYAMPGLIASALHAGALAPFLWPSDPAPAPLAVDAVEIAPVPEAMAPEQATAASVAEAIDAAPPEPAEVSNVPPDPAAEAPLPETLRSDAPPAPVEAALPADVDAAAAPEPVAATPPPEPVAEAPTPAPVAAAPPEEVALIPPAEAIRPEPQVERVAAAPPLLPPPPDVARPAQIRPPLRPPSRAPARAAPAEAPSASAAAAPAASAPVVRRPPPSYIGALLAALDRHKEYPAQARWRRAEGIAVLRFAMRRDGTVVAWRIVQTTGHDDLDAAVVRMIQRASPLPPPPPELAGDPVDLVVPVRFSLR